VYCSSPFNLRKQLKRLLKRLHNRNHYPPKLDELKFYLPTSKLYKNFGYTENQVDRYKSYEEKNRIKIIKILNQNCSGVYSAVCDKSLALRDRFKSGELLGNWLFANTLTKYVIPEIYFRHPPTILFDKGRLSASRCNEFQLYLYDKDSYLRWLGITYNSSKLGEARDCASYAEPGIWASDIVAGAYRYAWVKNDPYYMRLIVNKIGYGHRYYW
jgi:hypothetical protein